MDLYGAVFNGFALENAKFYLLCLTTLLNEKLDFFILGSTIYKIMTGYKIFLKLNEFDNKEDIKRQYIEGRFFVFNNVIGGYIVYKY